MVNIKISSLIIAFLCFFIGLYSCISEDKNNADEAQKKRSISSEIQKEDFNKTDSAVAEVPCSGVIKDVEAIPEIQRESVLILDWTIGNAFLSGYESAHQYDNLFSVKTINYKYKDSVVVYVHFYKYLDPKNDIDFFNIIRELNGKVLHSISISKLGERIFGYFIEETDDYDILVIDIPPNWESSYELREEFKQKLLEAFSCTFLLCDESDPCKFYNVAGGAN